jgi:DNA-binding transcriptional ArsR family regulator
VEVFEAVADPVRREILVALGDGTLSAGEIAGRFAISRPAVSRHLRVLRESGLVRDEVSGRRRLYRLLPEGLDPLRTWLADLSPVPSHVQGSAAVPGEPSPTGSSAPVGVAWSARLDALETEVRRTRRDRRRADSADSADSADHANDHPATTKETA